MKKILVIHTKYRNLGGEDIAVASEVRFLKKFYDVRTIYFSNTIINYPSQFLAFITNKNKRSINKIVEQLDDFNPDIVYIHNTWFKASLGIFKILENYDLKVLLKLHNLRYECSKSIFQYKHFNDGNMCRACGQTKKNYTILNKYFDGNLLKSIILLRYGTKYIKILKNNNINILVLTKFHLQKLINLGVDSKKIHLFPNYIDSEKNILNYSENYIVYAGRISKEKGVDELVECFLKAKLSDTKLKIIGDGPDFTNLKKKYQQSNIEFYGQINNNDVKNIIKNSKGVVTATKLYEGQPTLLCEAAMLGVPSIFPKSGGISDFFPTGYKFSFDFLDYEGLLSKLRLLEDEKTRLNQGMKSKVYIEKYLNEKDLMNRFEDIVNEKQ